MTGHTNSIPTLPQGHILGYLTGPVETPTRVRVIAARVTLAAGIAAAVVSVYLIVAMALQAYDIATKPAWFFFGPFPPIAPPSILSRWTTAIKSVLRDDIISTVMLPYFVTGVVLLPLLVRPIKRGGRAPCKIALVYFAISIIPAFLATLILSCHEFVDTFNAHPREHNWWAVFWLLGLPLGGMFCVLLKDAVALLLWIIRNPSMEKPPVPFLPGATSTTPVGGTR